MGYTSRPADGPGGPDRHDDDDARLRHARSQHEGFDVGRYMQPPPLLFTRDGHNVFLGDMYRGRTAFLLCGGPSLATHDLTRLNERGFLTCAVNNAASLHRPNLWVSADDPGNFCDVIWRDPGILKFVPLCHMEKHFTVRNEQDELVQSRELVGDMPAVFGLRRNEAFRAETWMYEDTFNWGNHSRRVDAYGNKGSRSIMYIALRLLFYLGVRRLYLLGCDFKMEHGRQNYAFEQDRSRASVRGNNSSYRILNARLERLKPYFQREGFEVYNCTPESGLTAFSHLPFEQAVDSVRDTMPKRIVTSGMYDRKSSQRRTEKPADPNQVTVNGADRSSALPELTLVVGVSSRDARIWKATWKTWMRFKPWLEELPLLTLHDPTIDPSSLEFGNKNQSRRFVPLQSYGGLSPAESLPWNLVCKSAEFVKTPWYLQLDPRAVATSDARWLSGDWFDKAPDGRTPVFVSCPWSYTKPANAIEQLDDWADQVPGLAEHPRVDPAWERKSDRIVHRTINSWCFIGNTEWTREISAYLKQLPPTSAHSTFVHYCALRRGDAYRTVQLKDYGWEHHFRAARWFIRRCQQVLA